MRVILQTLLRRRTRSFPAVFAALLFAVSLATSGPAAQTTNDNGQANVFNQPAVSPAAQSTQASPLLADAPIETFEGYAPGSQVMLHAPGYCTATTGIDLSTDVAEVSAADANNPLEPGTGTPGGQSYRLFWTWTNPGSGFVRATTYNAANRPNPIVDFSRDVTVYVKVTQGEADFGLWLRETGVAGLVGDNGGATGFIEQTSLHRLTASPDWQRVTFDLPNERVSGLTGNGLLDGHYGTIESFVFRAVPGSTDANVEMYIDNVSQGPSQNSSLTAQSPGVLPLTRDHSGAGPGDPTL